MFSETLLKLIDLINLSSSTTEEKKQMLMLISILAIEVYKTEREDGNNE